MRKPNKFGAYLKNKRGATSQSLVANALDMPVATYQNWEQGRNEPHPIMQGMIRQAMEKLYRSGG